MKYKVTLNGRTYEIEVEAGKAMCLDEYEAYAPVAAPAAPAATPAAAETAPAAAPAAPAASHDKLNGIILSAIADKTGYPEDMIDNDMELEADLGIDSIKRVEIFAEVLKKLSITLTPDQTEMLSTKSTVEDIAAYLGTL